MKNTISLLEKSIFISFHEMDSIGRYIHKIKNKEILKILAAGKVEGFSKNTYYEVIRDILEVLVTIDQVQQAQLTKLQDILKDRNQTIRKLEDRVDEQDDEIEELGKNLREAQRVRRLQDYIFMIIENHLQAKRLKIPFRVEVLAY